MVVVDVAVLQHTEVVLFEVPVLALLADVGTDVVVFAVYGHAVLLVDRVKREPVLALLAVLLIIIETVFEFAVPCRRLQLVARRACQTLPIRVEVRAVLELAFSVHQFVVVPTLQHTNLGVVKQLKLVL